MADVIGVDLDDRAVPRSKVIIVPAGLDETVRRPDGTWERRIAATDFMQKIAARNPEDGYLLWSVANGIALEGPQAEWFIKAARAAYEAGPAPASMRERRELYTRLTELIDRVTTAPTGTGDAIVVPTAVAEVVRAAFRLSGRWPPSPERMVDRAGEVSADLAALVRMTLTAPSTPARRIAFRRLAEHVRAMTGETDGAAVEVPTHPQRARVWAFLLPFRLLQDLVRWLSGGPVFGDFYRALRLLRRHWRIPVGIAVRELAASVPAWTIPFCLGLVAYSAVRLDVAGVLIGIGLAATASIVAGVLEVVLVAYQSAAVERLWTLWMLRIAKRFLHADLGRFAPGELVFRFEDAEATFHAVLDCVLRAIRLIWWVLPFPLFLLLAPPVFVVHIVLTALVLAGLYAAMSVLVYRYALGIANLRGRLTARLTEALTGALWLRAFRATDTAIRRVWQEAEPLRERVVAFTIIQTAIETVIGLVIRLAPLVLVAEAVMLVKAGQLSPYAAVAIGGWFAFALGPVREFLDLGPLLARGTARARRFLEAYGQASPARRRGKRPFPAGRRLRIAASFAPTPWGPPVWSLNTVVDLRKPVVIVGPSGAGKTTLLMAIAGIIRPTTGTIEIDGVNVEDLDTKDIVLVPKEDFVVEGSIWENLTYGVEGEVSQAVARMHLERLGLWEAIDAKGGLGAPVVGMSSGEIKRLMVVRALLLSSRLLLLDEPTSGLDIQTATYLLETLTSLPFKVIITTHQPLPAVETTIVLSKRT